MLAAANVQKAGGQTGLVKAVALVVGVVLRRVEGVLEGGEAERLELLLDCLLIDVFERQGPVFKLNNLNFDYTDLVNTIAKNSLLQILGH